MLAHMSQQTTPEIADRFDRHWRFVSDVLCGVMKGLGPSGKPVDMLHPLSWRILHRELVLAESLLRRLLVLLALSMTPPLLKQRLTAARNAPQTRMNQPNAKQTRQPLFHLTEPDDTAPYLSQPRTNAPSTAPPRFWVPGMEAMYPALPAPRAAQISPISTDALIRRLTALQDVLSHPGKHTARMANWIATRRAIAQDTPYDDGRTIPIRHAHPPGMTRKRLRDIYADARRLHHNALVALLRASPNTS
jgi:hypothetical protein